MAIKDEWQVGMTMSLIVLFLLISFANGAVLFTILRPRNRHRLGTPTNYLVANLALTDVMVAMTSIPGTLLSLHDLPKTFRMCVVLQCLILLPTKVSSFGYLALSIERVVAIKLPFSYIRMSTKRNAKIIITLTWLFGIAFVCSGLFRLHSTEFRMNSTLAKCTVDSAMSLEFMVYAQFLGNTFPTAIAIGAMYVVILIEVRAMTRTDKMKSQKRLSLLENWRRAEGRAALRCGLLMGTFVLCQLPIGLTGIVNLWFGVQCRQCQIVFLCFFLGNSAINPLLYSLTNKDLKVEMCRLFACIKRHTASASYEAQEHARLYHLRKHSLNIITPAYRVHSILATEGIGSHAVVGLSTTRVIDTAVRRTSNHCDVRNDNGHYVDKESENDFSNKGIMMTTAIL